MAGSVGVAKTGGIDASVDLGGRDRGVAQQLLGGTQIGPALEQMRANRGGRGGGRTPRRDRRLASPEAKAPGHVGVGEAAAALGEEQRRLAWIGEEGAPAPF